MKLISPQEYSDLRSELNEFVVLCKSHKYRPDGSDFHDIINFLLLYNDAAGGSRLCESYEENSDKIVNHLFESFKEEIEAIDEVSFKGDSEYDNSKDFDTATGSVITAGKMALSGAVIGTVATAQVVTYLFKRRKVRKMTEKELEAEMDKLAGYEKLTQLKKKLAELKGEPVGKIEYPTMAEGPELEEPPQQQ